MFWPFGMVPDTDANDILDRYRLLFYLSLSQQDILGDIYQYLSLISNKEKEGEEIYPRIKIFANF